MTDIQSTKTSVSTTGTSISILDVLMELEGATVTQVAQEIGCAKSTAHRHLKTLNEYDFVVREGDYFHVGLRLLEFGKFAQGQSMLYRIGRDRMKQIADETGDKVWVVVEENGMGYLIYRVMGSYPIETNDRIGRRDHLHQTASGKAILAAMDDDRVNRVIEKRGLPARTKNTVTNPENLFEELDDIRDSGVAFNRGESVANLRAVGSAICNDEGQPIGAISISGNQSRFTTEYMVGELKPIILSAKNDIEINLSHQTRNLH